MRKRYKAGDIVRITSGMIFNGEVRNKIGIIIEIRKYGTPKYVIIVQGIPEIKFYFYETEFVRLDYSK